MEDVNKMAVTDYQRKKWAALFDSADINNDGVITEDDGDLWADRFAGYYKMDQARAEQLRSDFRKVWKDLFLFERTEIGPDDYIKEMEAAITRDKAGFWKRMHEIQQKIVDVFDYNNDGKISEEEFAIVMKCFGMAAFDRKFVERFPQSPKGYIPKDVWRDAWTNFYCNGDENNTEKERPLAESLGLL